MAPRIQPRNTGRIFKDPPPRLRFCVDNFTDLPLTHQRMRASDCCGVFKQQFNVFRADLLAVQLRVLRGGAAVIARRYATRHGAPALIAPQLAVAGVAAFALSIPAGRDFAPEGGFAGWHLPAMALFGVTTYLGFFSMMKANEIGTTGQVSVICYCVTLFGVVGGVAVFGDAVTAALIAGGLLIVVSVTLIGMGSSTRPTPSDG